MAIESVDLWYEYQFNQNVSSFKQRASNKVFQSLFTFLVKIGRSTCIFKKSCSILFYPAIYRVSN